MAMFPFHLVCCWFLNILHTVWVAYKLNCIVGLGFEENSFLNVPRDNVWKSVFWTDMVYFKRCPVLSKPDSAQPAKQTPADSLFLPLARCPLTVWVHVCVSEPARETVWRHRRLNVSSSHGNAHCRQMCVPQLHHAAHRGWWVRGRC